MVSFVVPSALANARAAAEEGANWTSSGRTDEDAYYSPLARINTNNVEQLGLAWYLDLPGERTLQATPLAIDGVLYFSGSYGKAYAVDARSGRQLWKYDPDLVRHRPDSEGVIFGANRGVAFWQGKVYVGTVDGRLVALNAKTGSVVWSTQTLDEPNMHKSISGAPTGFNGKVIIGHGGYDESRGYVTAYDAKTGRKLWRFYTVPGDPKKGFENAAMAMAAKTWPGEWWKLGGHAVVWDGIVFDSELNRLYFGTASAMSVEKPPKGDKLFSSSIVALDADSGDYLWHYQVNPADSLEYESNFDATNQITLAELTIDGKPRKVLMQVPKNGFFYVIDRSTGKLISAEKIGKVTWAERIDLTTGRPVKAPAIPCSTGPDAPVAPSAFGIRGWQRLSFDPRTGLAYIPTIHLGSVPDSCPEDPDQGTGGLLAWDPVAQKKRWEVRHPDSFWNGGTLATGGNLVFQGTGRGLFMAFDAGNGQKLWTFDAGHGINAAPMTFMVDGVQYVSLLVGFGGTANMSRYANYGWRFNEQPRRLLTFALNKQERLPPGLPPRFDVRVVDDPEFVIDTALAAKGASAYYPRCVGCHGVKLENYASIGPDLRESALAMNWEAYKSVVQGGALAALGMPKFDNLTEEELRGIYMYIRQRARETAASKSDP